MISNYEITKQKAQKAFLKYDQEKMIDKFSLEAQTAYLYLTFLGHRYRIDRKTGYLEWSEDDFVNCIEADFNEAMTIYDLLCDSKELCCASGEYVRLKSLSGLQSGSKRLGDGLLNGTEKIFDHKEAELSTVCERLGGVKAGLGDVAYEIPVFDFLKCRIQFWSSDEEFEAALHVFMDKNILQFLRYETIWYLQSHLLKRLQEEMNENI